MWGFVKNYKKLKRHEKPKARFKVPFRHREWLEQKIKLTEVQKHDDTL